MITFELINLAQLSKEILDCATGDHSTADILTVGDASQVAAKQVVNRVGRPLNSLELALTYIAMFTEWTQRRERMRAQLLDTQRRLASPHRRLFA
jgi:hypothetical protein